jgi:class 3 adenylate cyclase
MLDLAANEPLLTDEQRRWHRESRAAWLRLVALALLAVNLGLSERQVSLAVYACVVGGYGIATFAALALVRFRRGGPWWGTVFVTLDALIVVILPAHRWRQAAVMFVDLRSFTRLSESIALEELAMLLAEFRELVTRAVFAHGGMIDKFIGDGVMAAFGQPRTTANDAARALDCAIHLQGALLEWKALRLAGGQPAPDAGIGLHFGIAIGGVLHSGSHDEFTLIGDAVNVAQRLEQLCKPLNASLVVSEDVLAAANRIEPVAWRWVEDVELAGRIGRKRVAYLLSPQEARFGLAGKEKAE